MASLGAEIKKTLQASSTEVSNDFKNIASNTQTGVNSVKNEVKTGLSAASTSASNSFSSIRSSASSAMNGAVSSVRSGVNSMTNSFNNTGFNFGHYIRLPHFWMSGSFNLERGTVPRVGVDWYDKGGIFRSPTVIGVGEKRPEFVGALDDLRTIVREESNTANVTINVYGQENQNVRELANIVMNRIQQNIDRREAAFA